MGKTVKITILTLLVKQISSQPLGYHTKWSNIEVQKSYIKHPTGKSTYLSKNCNCFKQLPTLEALIVKTNSPFQYQRKCIKKNVENLDTDVMW